MKKLNNKGLSIIELLVCFVLVAGISVTLLNIIMEYKSMQETENIKNIIKTYKDEVTEIIERDIIVKSLTNAEMTRSSDKYITITLTFKNSFDTGSNTKELKVYSDNNTNYIEYPDVVKKLDGSYKLQPVRYKLPHTTQIYATNVNDLGQSSKVKMNDIYFRNLPTPLDGDRSFVDTGVFHLYIPIEHSEIDGTYAIDIITPTIQ